MNLKDIQKIQTQNRDRRAEAQYMSAYNAYLDAYGTDKEGQHAQTVSIRANQLRALGYAESDLIRFQQATRAVRNA